MHLNSCLMIGRVSPKGPQLRYAENGTPFTTFVLEVDEVTQGKTYTTYIPCEIIVTIAEQAETLEQAYATFARQQTRQPWHTEEDRREALNTLKARLREAERCLRLEPTSDTASARSKLILWVEMVKGTIEEGASRQ